MSDLILEIDGVGESGIGLLDRVRNAWNRVISAVRNWSASISGMRGARVRASSRMRTLQRLAPQIRDRRWLAEFARLRGEYRALAKRYSTAVGEHNRVAKEVRRTKPRGDGIRGIGEAGLGGILAIIGIATAGIAIAASIKAAYNRFTADTQALIDRVATEKLVVETQQQAITEETRKRTVAEAELARLDARMAHYEARYQETRVPGYLENIRQLRTRRDEILGIIVRPVPFPTPVVLPGVPPVVPPGEVPALQRWLGISPRVLVLLILVGLVIMGAPRIAEAVKRR